MLKANFTITETGGTGVVQLQSSADSGTTWQNVGSQLTLTGGSLTVDDSTDLDIITSVYTPGQSYQFRLTDTAGTPVSDAVTYTIPLSAEILSLSVADSSDKTAIEFTLTAANGSGSYRIRAKGGVLGTDYVDQLDDTSAPADASFLLGSLDIGGPHPYIYGITYTFQAVDIDTGVASGEVSYTTPQITRYASVTGLVDFTNTGGDNWDVLFHITPDDAVSSSGAAITSYDREIIFYAAGTALPSDKATGLTTDETVSVSHGAGVYAISQGFNFADGAGTRIYRLIRVDGAGTILGDIEYNGITVNSASGMDIDVSGSFAQGGVSESPILAAVNIAQTSVTDLAAGTSYTGPVPPATGAIFLYSTLDPTFWSDLPSYAFISHGLFSCGSVVTIS